MSNAVVTIHGWPVVPATVLGQGASRIPTAGKIRAGIRVLSRTASEQPHAREIYEQGVAAGESFEQIAGQGLSLDLSDLTTLRAFRIHSTPAQTSRSGPAGSSRISG